MTIMAGRMATGRQAGRHDAKTIAEGSHFDPQARGREREMPGNSMNF